MHGEQTWMTQNNAVTKYEMVKHYTKKSKYLRDTSLRKTDQNSTINEDEWQS